MKLISRLVLGLALVAWASEAKQLQKEMKRKRLGPKDIGDENCEPWAKTQYRHLSQRHPLALDASKAAIALLNAQRLQCDPPQPPLHVDDNCTTYYIHARHKFAADCSGETVKLSWVDDAGLGFHVHLMQKFPAKGTWTLLQSIPSGCHISDSTKLEDQSLSVMGIVAKTATRFAVFEIGERMRREECLNVSETRRIKDDDFISIEQVISAQQYVVKDMSKVRLLLYLQIVKDKGKKKIQAAAKVSVKYDCNIGPFERCKRSIYIPAAKICDTVVPLAEDKELVQEIVYRTRLGAKAPDPTVAFVAESKLLHALPPVAAKPASSGVKQGGQKSMGKSGKKGSKGALLLNTRPSEGRLPPTERYIVEGEEPPAEYDPRPDPCLSSTPYDQASCGSCYAQAFSFMIGARHCLAQKGFEAVLAAGGSQPARQRRGKAGKSGQKSPTRALGYVPDAPPTPAPLTPAPPTPAPLTPAAQKSKSLWGRMFGLLQLQTPRLRMNVLHSLRAAARGLRRDWHGGHHSGHHHGDGNHHRLQLNVHGSRLRNDPPPPAGWDDMPSVTDIAAGPKKFCAGGSSTGTWIDWMQGLKRPLWKMGENCLPDKIRCAAVSNGVTNPAKNAQKCAKYEKWPEWSKPCSCFNAELVKGGVEKQAPETDPNERCSLPVPASMHKITNMQHGLSNQDAVLNMQKHIVESGPIWVAFECTDKFQSWNWYSNPVYTRTPGAKNLGGHAVVAVGYKTVGGTDAWIIRNSWGLNWADKGHCLFQRGINLDRIESFEISAVIPEGATLEDWVVPSCRTSGLSRQTSKGRGVMEATIKWTCDRPADISISIPHHSDPTKSTVQENLKTQGNTEENTVFDLIKMGFPLGGKLDLKVTILIYKGGKQLSQESSSWR